MDQQTIAAPEKILRPLSSKEASVWNALDKLYFEDQIPYRAITLRAIIEARKLLEGAGGDAVGLGTMRERWRAKNKIDPDNDQNVAQHAAKGLRIDPLLRITSEIRNEIRQSLEAELETEREEYISRIQSINAELNEIKTMHDALKQKHIALDNEHQHLKEKHDQIKTQLIVAQTEKNLLESNFDEYKKTTAATFQNVMSEQSAQITNIQQLNASAEAKFLAAVSEQSQTHQNLIADIINKNETQRQRLMVTLDAERTRADKAETELRSALQEKATASMHADQLLNNLALQHQEKDAKLRLEIQALAEQFDLLGNKVSKEVKLIAEPIQTQIKELLAKVAKLAPSRKKQRLEN